MTRAPSANVAGPSPAPSASSPSRRLHAMGKVPTNDVESIEAVFERHYGTGLEGIEEPWRAYCAKR